MTNFELGVHVPLILRAPWIPTSIGQKTAVLAELVDLFPTLAALAGLPDPRSVPGSAGINGTSLVPALVSPGNSSALKPAAYSQFSKNNRGTNVDPKYFRNATQTMGYSVRTNDWRYTAWFVFNGTGARGPLASGGAFGSVVVSERLGAELYDHRGDTCEWLDWPGDHTDAPLLSYTATKMQDFRCSRVVVCT
jgi:iduronate 2-sulfatase